MCNHEFKVGETYGLPPTYTVVNGSDVRTVDLCPCVTAAPTYPVYRDNPHLPGCRFYVATPKSDHESQ
jgi:hypothetical protein